MTPINITSFEQGSWTSRMLAPGQELIFPREELDVTLHYHEEPWRHDNERRPSLTLRTVSRVASVDGRARAKEAS